MNAEPQSSQTENNTRSGQIAAGLLVAGIAGAAMLSSKPARAITPALTFANIPGTGDIQVLNYALALEDLEADLYKQALFRLTTGGVSSAGINIPGLGLSGIDVNYIAEFAPVEAEHRDFLRTALGASALPPGTYDFGLETMTRPQVSALVYLAEKTGVTAYLGAIPFFQTKTYLPVAAGILGTEARHTAILAIVQNILFGTNIETAPLSNENMGRDMPATPDSVLAAVSPFIVTV